ncbi:MAG: carbohydrate ABC transporter permease [Bacillales bacterium]|jgi:ABC-type glycerol-3-phosphate transport system permease component|nr:carbohydrate ABC transporter permease [Bacillales bacterium]
MASQTLIDSNKKARIWNYSKVGVIYLVCIIIGIILVFPYTFMVFKSLMTSDEVINPNVVFFPSNPQWKNYLDIFTADGGAYLKALGNSLIVILFNVIAIPISASIIAYSFAKLKFFGHKIMWVAMMLTMFLPGVATQIPLYVMYAKWGWLDSLLPLTIPNLFGGSAFYIFLIHQFMKGIPQDLLDAAKVEGASAFRIYWSIVLPLCKPVLIYIMVSIFIANWGDFYGPLVYMSSSDAPRTIAYYVYLRAIEGDSASQLAHVRMAAGTFMTIIPAILFGLFQKQLTEGVVMTGLKG